MALRSWRLVGLGLLLGYGIAHFAVYIGSVIVVAPLGIAAVAADAALVHSAFVVVAYVLLLGGRRGHPLRVLWADIAPASVASLFVAIAAVPVARFVPGLTGFLAVATISAAIYPVALRTGFPEAWSDLCSLVRRIVPIPGFVRRRLPRVACAQTSTRA